MMWWHWRRTSRIIAGMKTRAFAFIVSAFLIAGPAAAFADKTDVPTGTEIGQRLPQFTAPAIDASSGKTVEFDSHKTTQPTIYIFIGTHCPATAAYAERLTQMEKTYAPKGVDIVYLYPNNEDSKEAAIAFHKEKRFTGRLIHDQGAQLARLFNAHRTSELFLVNKDGVIVYHGAIDDSRDPGAVKQRYLATALDELLAGKPITTTSSTVSA